MEKTAADMQSELKEVLHAVAILERIYPGIRLVFPDGASNLAPLSSAANGDVRPRKKGRKRSNIRETVAQAATKKSLSIGELADITGLEKDQVRGCINAPALKDLYEREADEEGVMRYQYIGE